MKEKLKIAIVGAGSSYTPELIEGLSDFKSTLPVEKIYLYDIDESRLSIMYDFVKRYINTLDFKVEVFKTLDRKEALIDADFVAVQIRVGGNEARVNDEKIPLKYNVLGQETTGIGGMFNAFRVIPKMIEIAKDVEKYCPDAWIVNYSNPTGLVTEAVQKVTKAKIAGLCAGGMRPRWWASEELGVEKSKIYYDYVGLNHLSFAYNFSVDGKPINADQFCKISKHCKNVNNEWINELGLIPSMYTQYYYHTNRRIKELKNQNQTRGESILELEKQIFREYAEVSTVNKPKTLLKRGGGGYSEVAIGIMNAIYNETGQWMVVNVPNNGTLDFLPDSAVIETACYVSHAGIKPINIANYPKEVVGLITQVKMYEMLAVEAAISGDKNIALKAVMAHPLVGQYEIAKPLLEEMFEAHKQYLPQFND